MIGESYTFTSAEQCRCECGNLLAKFVPEGIELKCRRCKRIVLLRFAEIQGWERAPSPNKETTTNGQGGL